jgi:catechol 2,3-dioxygenase
MRNAAPACHTLLVSNAHAPRDPEELEATGVPAAAELAPATTMGAVHLTVADLGRSVDYYRAQIGLEVLAEQKGTAVLGAGDRKLLVLHEEPGARPADGYSGLYHFALLVPGRRDLACWLAHAARERVALTGLSDHAVSEAIYLRDPDGHGIEIYGDRPREQWEGRVLELMTTIPLDTHDLLSELDDPATEAFDGLPDGTLMGHVHLRVAEIESTVDFYRDVGFDLMAQLGRQAAFMAVGGYHHQLGANTWESAGRPQPPPGHANLRHATIVLPDTTERDRVLDRVSGRRDTESGPMVEDPSGNRFALEVVGG